MFEVEVHHCLKSFLKNRQQFSWHHHLTMARLVARAFRLDRSILIQTGASHQQYNLSYLIPALLEENPVIIVLPKPLQEELLIKIIPILQQELQLNKPIKIIDHCPCQDDFSGILLTYPQLWLEDRLLNLRGFPPHIPVIIDQADDLLDWARDCLTIAITPQNWQELMIELPKYQNIIRNTRIKLTKTIFNRPPNPYECWVINNQEKDCLEFLFEKIKSQLKENSPLRKFWQKWQEENFLVWASINRKKGLFSLFGSPINLAHNLSVIWQKQTVVMIGSCLDYTTDGRIFRQQIGYHDVTCLKFSPHSNKEQLQLYIPDHFPLPNTPQFAHQLMMKIEELLSYTHAQAKPVVILCDDLPLKSQIASILAGKLGSKVKLENPDLSPHGILVCGWEFWQKYQFQIRGSQLLIMVTLPLPSLENPLVAGKVAYYKQQKQDWFRLYLLPHSLTTIQRAVLGMRENQGVVALLDNRVNFRSYGQQILSSLEPFARYNYIDPSWFEFEPT